MKGPRSSSPISPAEAGEATVKEITDAGGKAAFFRHDVTSEADWEAATARAVEIFGGLDIVVNNAGMGDLKTIEDTTLEEWNRTIDIDQTGVFLGMKVAGPHLKSPITPRSSTSARSSAPAAASAPHRRTTPPRVRCAR